MSEEIDIRRKCQLINPLMNHLISEERHDLRPLAVSTV